MSDFDRIFRIIQSNPERKKNRAAKEQPRAEAASDFLLGDEEKRYRSRQKEQERDVLDQDIGGEKKKQKEKMNSIQKLDFIELNRMQPKQQTKVLKIEYLELIDRLEELTRSSSQADKQLNETQIIVQKLKKDNIQLKEMMRLIINKLPDGYDLKKTVETPNWEAAKVEIELLERIQNLVERVKSVDEYIERKMEASLSENKILKKKLVHYEAEMTKLEEELDQQEAYYAQELEKAASGNQAVQKPEAASPLAEAAVPGASEASKEDIKEQIRREMQSMALPGDTQEHSSYPLPPTLPPSAPLADAPVQNQPPKRVPRPARQPENAPIMEQPPAAVNTPPEQGSPAALPARPRRERKREFLEEIEKEEAAEKEEVVEVDSHILLDIEMYLSKLPETHTLLIQMIGETGVSRNAELRPLLENDAEGAGIFFKGNKFSYQDMSASIKSLREGGFLDSEKINLGARGGYNYTVYELTELGKAIYIKLTGKKAAISEKKLITNQHKTMEHGYLIKDCATEFSEMGYTVYTDRKDLRFDLPDGKRKDFDLIIEKDGHKSHIEVERGTHNDEDFFDAMDKIYKITNEFYFIAPNEEKLYGKTKVQFYKWINNRLGGMDKAKGKITVHFATFEKIKKRGKTLWETIKL